MTISVPTSLLKRVKVVAASRDTSISALITTALEDIADGGDGYRSSMRRMLARMREGSDLGTGGRIAVQREELHGRP